MPPAGGPTVTVARVLSDWTPDALLALGVAAVAAAYLVGVRVLRRRGDRWSPGRTLAFCSGLGLVVVATMSGLGTYDDTLFSVHMVQHMLLSMVAPVPLALGAPVTLALRTLPRRERGLALGLLHSRASRVLTHPALALGLFIGSTFALYLSPIYPYSLAHGWAHELVHVHFLLTGCLFAWVVLGLDPLPGRPSYAGRMLIVVAALPFHAFLGVTLLSTRAVIAQSHYAALGFSPAAMFADQQTGAGLLWASGEFVGVLLLFTVLAQWMRSEERLAVRTDRNLDRLEAAEAAAVRAERDRREQSEEAALAAYNERLAALHAASGGGPAAG